MSTGLSTGTLGAAPRALILDYGGVVVSTTKRPSGFADLAAVVDTTLRRAGIEIPRERLEQSLRAGTAALKDYNNMSSRRREPLELGHRELWVDFMASDLPEAARLVLGADAVRLSQAKVELLSAHAVRPGVRELLALCRERGIRTGISSNAQSGAAHRALIEANGLTDLFDVQLYSDGVGVRKPHPAMLHLVADALDVPIEESWYVGDTRDRDMLAGRRAGIGAVVLIRHHNTDSPRYAVEGEPDGIFEEVTGLVEALRAAAPVSASTSAPVVPVAPVVGAAVPTVSEPVRRTAPTALLLDNGGVLSLSEKSPEGIREFAGLLSDYLRGAGHDVDDERIHADVLAGRKRHKAWKAEHDHGAVVPEVTARQFWEEFVAVDWTPQLRAAVVAEAPDLLYELAKRTAVRHLRPGMAGVLQYARDHGVPVGIVSNTVCGRVPRENQIAWGLEPLVGVSFFSDEFGFRKPDPSIVRACAAALGADLAGAWFVGDKRGRDVAVARRSGVGTAVLIESRQTSGSDGPDPDVSVADATELLEALKDAVEGTATSAAAG